MTVPEPMAKPKPKVEHVKPKPKPKLNKPQEALGIPALVLLTRPRYTGLLVYLGIGQ